MEKKLKSGRQSGGRNSSRTLSQRLSTNFDSVMTQLVAMLHAMFWTVMGCVGVIVCLRAVIQLCSTWAQYFLGNNNFRP